VKECPFCLTPVDENVVECPHCLNRLDVYRTGYYVRPNLSRPKTAVIWASVLLVIALLALALVRACAVAPRPLAGTSSSRPSR
jgi:hypothetical protein